MQFELNTLENSYDFLKNSLEFYRVADEYGTHDPERSNLEDKKKWKMAFIFLVQSTELLIKEILSTIHPLLVFDNIDLPLKQNDKTVSFSKAIIRLCNFKPESVSEEEHLFLRQCAKRRNDYIHSKVTISTPDIKPKYCRLFQLYKKIHNNYIATPLNFENKKLDEISREIEQFLEKYVIFRGVEIRKDYYDILLEEIELNKKYCFYKTIKGELFPRIKYGSEQFYNELNNDEEHFEVKQFTYCADCAAKIGEYHLDGCDWEVCPICFGQALSCDCEATLSDENGNEFDSPYNMQ